LDHFSRGDGSEEREEPVHTWSTRNHEYSQRQERSC